MLFRGEGCKAGGCSQASSCCRCTNAEANQQRAFRDWLNEPENFGGSIVVAVGHNHADVIAARSPPVGRAYRCPLRFVRRVE